MCRIDRSTASPATSPTLAPSKPLPPDLVATLQACQGPAAQAWLDALPALAADLSDAWHIALGAPLPELSYHLVVEARLDDGRPAILKLGPPNSELATEILALEAYAGRGAVRLLAADAERGALLLERLQPGDSLAAAIGPTGAGDETATLRAAELMRTLWQAPAGSRRFPSVADWGSGFERLRRRFDGGCGPLPAWLVERAERRFGALEASSGQALLLHGDLHHGNILRAGKGWRAIDPKGLLGEAAYEAGALLRNPWPVLLDWPDPAAVLARRAAILAERLELDRRRILGWGMAQAVLSAWWCIEDAGSEAEAPASRARAEPPPATPLTPVTPSIATTSASAAIADDGAAPCWAFSIAVAELLAHLEDAT